MLNKYLKTTMIEYKQVGSWKLAYRERPLKIIYEGLNARKNKTDKFVDTKLRDSSLLISHVFPPFLTQII